MACSPGIHGRSACHSLAICFRPFKLTLNHIDLVSLCNNCVFQDVVLRGYAAQCPNLKSIVNVELTSGKIDCMDTLTFMTKLTKLHFVSFQLGNYNFACLVNMLPTLRDLSIDNLFLDDAFRLDNFVQNVEQPRLNLHRLDIRGFGEFGSLCYLERLSSLSLSVRTDPLFQYYNNMEIYCRNLQKCTEIRRLHLDLGVRSDEDLRSFLRIVDVLCLTHLENFTLASGCTSPDDFQDVLGKFCKNVTKLTADAYFFPEYALSKYDCHFGNVCHLFYHHHGMDPDNAFETLPNLQSLIIQYRPGDAQAFYYRVQRFVQIPSGNSKVASVYILHFSS